MGPHRSGERPCRSARRAGATRGSRRGVAPIVDDARDNPRRTGHPLVRRPRARPAVARAGHHRRGACWSARSCCSRPRSPGLPRSVVEWLRRWPTPADLAAEPAGEAIRAWGRLGYPRRALRLHAVRRRRSCAEHDGAVPTDLALLLGAARRRRLHGPRGGRVRVRAAAAGRRHQRPPAGRPGPPRARPTADPRPPRADLLAVDALLPRRAGPSRPGQHRAHGAGRARLHRPGTVLSGLSTAYGLRLAAGRPSARRRTRRRSPRVYRHRPPGPRASCSRWPDSLRCRAARPTRRGRPDPAQLARALASLLADGLLVAAGPDLYTLP